MYKSALPKLLLAAFLPFVAGCMAAAGGSEPYLDRYGFVIRTVDLPPALEDPGLYAKAEDTVHAWFGGVFPTLYDPTTEEPAPGMLSVEAATAVLSSYLESYAPGLTVDQIEGSVYTWIGGREYCIHYFSVYEPNGDPWGFEYEGETYFLEIGCFVKQPIGGDEEVVL